MQLKYLADHWEAIPEIAGWYFAEWSHRIDEHSAEQLILKLQKYLNRDRIPLMRLAVDSDDNSIMGVAQLKLYEMDIYPEWKYWLGGVFVPPEYRDRKIATALVEDISRQARFLKVPRLYLQTERLDGGLYKHQGWIPIEKVIYKGTEVLVMEKHLIPEQ